MDTQRYNCNILSKISRYLNFGERSIDQEQVKEVESCGVSRHRAVELLFANYLDLDDIERRYYLPHILKGLDRDVYQKDAYYQGIKFKSETQGEWQLRRDCYAPYEIFVQDDFAYDFGKVLPQLGYFEEGFEYPAVYQNGVLWMSVTPNEINTMREPIGKARGRVLTFGLGLGYFAYMCSLKSDVTSVTVVEKDKSVIDLFERVILPQFEQRRKIHIVNADAYDYLNSLQDGQYDYAFVDIYHDAGDGLETYSKFGRQLNRFGITQFDFWIQKTIKYYL